MRKSLYLEGINAWFVQTIEHDCEEKASVDFLAPMLRRRLSPLGRAVLHSLNPLLTEQPDDKTAFIFASRWGDISLTEALLKELKDPDGVSPNRFSTSVHNAIGGQFSIFEHFTGFITALSGGSCSLSTALIEAQALLNNYRTVYICFYESRLPPAFSKDDNRGQTFSLALKLREATNFEQSLQVSVSRLDETSETNAVHNALSAIAFFEGRSDSWQENESHIQYRWYRQSLIHMP